MSKKRLSIWHKKRYSVLLLLLASLSLILFNKSYWTDILFQGVPINAANRISKLEKSERDMGWGGDFLKVENELYRDFRGNEPTIDRLLDSPDDNVNYVGIKLAYFSYTGDYLKQKIEKFKDSSTWNLELSTNGETYDKVMLADRLRNGISTLSQDDIALLGKWGIQDWEALELSTEIIAYIEQYTFHPNPIAPPNSIP